MSALLGHEDVNAEGRDPEHLGQITSVSLHSLDDDDPNIDFTGSLFKDDSPYAEVRSAVANTDDPTMPALTLRVWLLGLIWAVILPGVNQFFFFRYPSVTVVNYVPLLLSFPIGNAWARYFPSVTLFGISLNPGPFTIKEHVLITIMSNIGATSAYATNTVAVQRVFYNLRPPFIYQWLLVMSTQLIGYSFGGICKRFLVAPPSMIWPNNLLVCAIFNTMHVQETANIRGYGGISRGRFFLHVSVGYFCYNFLPSYLFTALSSFSWVCWIAPNNVKINQLFGVTHGMAMGILTFDWGQITLNGSPLSSPWWSAANIGATILVFYWFLVPILYYSNVWYSAFLPMVSSDAFDNRGHAYNVSKVINADTSFNLEAYEAYSPLLLSSTFAISYGLSFASITATLVHALLYYHKQIWIQAHRPHFEQPDIHARLMSVYKEVPNWWYLSIFVTMLVFGIVAIEVWNTHFPIWAFVFALVISFVYVIPIGMIQAITNQHVGLNVITEFIIGYALPGHPLAMMMFKTWGHITMTQAIQFTGDFKLGHYMKIPHYPMFVCQVIATIIAGTVQLSVQAWMFSNIQDMCSSTQPDGFICPSTTVFGMASIIWGVIGPKRLFSRGQLYHGLVFFFLIGAIAPLIQWVLHKKFGFTYLKYINFPAIFSATGRMPPATPLNFVPFVVLCFLFNYVIRRHHFSWWSKYNYILAAGLDVGYGISMLFIFFALQYPKNGSIGLNTVQGWWGNTVYKYTADFTGVAYKQIPDGGTFGPSKW